MGYRMRVFSQSDRPIRASDLQSLIDAEGIDARIMTEEPDTSWTVAELVHADAQVHEDQGAIAVIEREPVLPGSLAEGEIQEFCEDLVLASSPSSAVAWIKSYLPKTKTTYCFQILNGTYWGRGWDAVHAAFHGLHQELGGIVQADGEGFSNEDGFHITWDFSDDVEGPWNMAVLDEDGSWTAFEMDLGNPEHRAAFCAGRVPAGVTLL